MPLSIATIFPHTPLLIPRIGKENLEKLAQTRLACNKIEKKIIDKKINTIIIISNDKNPDPDKFFFNVQPKFLYNLEDFGDSSRDSSWNLDIETAYIIRENISHLAPLRLLSKEGLGHHFSVPLLLLTPRMQNIKIVPIYCSDLDFAAHFEFGKLIGMEIKKSKNNIAVICSGHLSGKIDKKSPAGYSPRGKKADKKIIELLKENKIEELLSMDPEYLNEAGEYHFKSILIQQGIINNTINSPKLLSYEAPFGIGYMVFDFEF